MGVIPEDQLEQAFNRAFREHTGNFPVSAYDLKAAYEAELAETAAVKKREREIEHIKEVSANRFECFACFNSGWRHVLDSAGKSQGVIRCDKCKYWEFYKNKVIG